MGEGLKIDGGLKWDGIEVVITVTVGGKYNREPFKKVLKDPVDPVCGLKFPSNKRLTDEKYRAKAQIADYFKKFMEDNKLVVRQIYWKKIDGIFGDKYVEDEKDLKVSDMASYLASKVWARRGELNICDKTVNGFAQAVRKFFDGQKKDGVFSPTYWCYDDDFYEFVGGEFVDVMEEAYDPVKDVMSKI